ncbi:tyrosine-type recombinase/integrase [Haladaptatus cibarius]|uniref:tyrosine-type recombinase/integrase n=1 Tax=Haladaptatus cibarius TaxID=453847 RepID=UPI00130D652B|nr:tyrosine-type recombinase/integrase [Haladaptatus cibarius]
MTELTPISPRDAVEMYITDRETELAALTLISHKSNLNRFVEWCDDNELKNLNTLSGRDLHQYRISRKQAGLAQTTLKGQLSTLRVFLRWAVTIEAVKEGLAEKILIPKVSDGQRHEMPDTETIRAILEYCAKYSYGSRDHAVFYFLWNTGCRTGTLRSLDLDNYSSSEQHVKVEHRPEEETPLKNKENAERYIALKPELCTVLDDYIEVNRRKITGEYGRNPLFTSHEGRLTVQTLRRTVYRLSRPCVYENDCPHDRSIEACDAAQKYSSSSKCPSSYSGHPMRRAAITHFLKRDVPDTVVSDRFDVSKEVISEHYDERTELEKVEQRRGYLDNI